MAFKKIEKEFCITDDSVNVYGYRLLTSGLMLDRFKPAIGFLMHNREGGVAVRWTDFRIEGDKVFAKPVVNESRFAHLRQEIEEGYYDAASVGSIVALELSNDDSMKVEGQTGPTVTKWFPREVSIVDIPGNYNAVAEDAESLSYDTSFVAFSGLSKLFDNNDRLLLDLVDYNNKHNINQKLNKMDNSTVRLEDLKLPGISGSMSINQINGVIEDLVAKASRVDEAEKAYADLKASVAKEKVTSIIEAGMKARKLTKEVADQLAKDYSGSPEQLQSLVDAMPAQQLVTDHKGEDIPERYKGRTYNDLYVSGELEEVKTKYPAYYETLKGNL